MTRQQKTPQQRAQEALDTSLRKVDRLAKAATRLSADLAHAQQELDAEKRRRDHLKQHPDLTTNGSTPTTLEENH